MTAKQLSKEWFDQRLGMITASNVGAILGIDPYRSADDVMRQMVRAWHHAEPEFTGNVATEWGIFNEETARGQFAMKHKPVQECGSFTSAHYSWLGASPDGLIDDDGVLEIKCPFGLRNEVKPIFKPLSEQPHYYAQVQIQLLATGRTTAYFYQWTPYGDYLQIVHIDDAWLRENIPKLQLFYLKYLSERDNPAHHLAPKRREITTLAAQKLIDEYQQLTNAIDLASERKKEVLAEIVEMAGNQNANICGHNLTQVKKDGAVSYAKAINALCPDADLSPYRGKPTEYWLLK